MKNKKEPARPAHACTICGLQNPVVRLIPRQLIQDGQIRSTVEWICASPCNMADNHSRRPASGHLPAFPGQPSFVHGRQVVPMMKAITIRQPWAWLIVNGFKDFENRPQKNRFTGRIFIHVSNELAENYGEIENMVGTRHGIILPQVHEFAQTAGRIVGVAYFGAQQAGSESVWFNGAHGWPILWAHQFVPTKPVKGQLGTWQAPADLTVEIKEVR